MPSDAIWRQRSGSKLAQVLACCLTAPSHYLNQCWLIMSNVLWHSSEGIIMRRSEDINQLNKIEIPFLESHPDFPGANELRWSPNPIVLCLQTRAAPAWATHVTAHMASACRAGVPTRVTATMAMKRTLTWSPRPAKVCNGDRNIVIVRHAGLLWSQQDFEWRWSVPLFKCLTVLEFSCILFDLCLLITFFNFIMNYVPIVTFWIFTYHKIWILSIMFCFIWSYWIIYFLACLEVSWRVVS